MLIKTIEDIFDAGWFSLNYLFSTFSCGQVYIYILFPLLIA